MTTLKALIDDKRIIKVDSHTYLIDRDRPILPPGMKEGKFKEISTAPPPGFGPMYIMNIKGDLWIGGDELDAFLRILPGYSRAHMDGHLVPLHPNMGAALLYLQEAFIDVSTFVRMPFVDPRYMRDDKGNRMKLIFKEAAFRDHSGRNHWLTVQSDGLSFSGEILPMGTPIKFKHWGPLAA